MNTLSNRIITGLSIFTLLLLSSTSSVQAQTQAWTGVCVSTTDATVATIQGLQCLIGNVLAVAITFIGLAGFVMLIYGGFRFMLSGGSSKATEDARNTLTFAVAGLVVALSSFIILNLIAAFTGISTVTNFVIPDPSTDFISQ